MWTFPVLLDSRPSFLAPGGPGTLLLTPLGRGTVLSHMRARVRGLTAAPPVIVTSFEPDARYREAARQVWPELEAVESEKSFAERCRSYDPSDRLLLADPACFPLDPHDPAFESLREDAASRWVTHLVAFQRHTDGTLEYVDSDSAGRVRGIQRYYASVTSPFAFGVACSLVPVACLRVVSEPALGSLPQLRRLLSSEGTPSTDVPLHRGALNLSTPAGVLAANERVVLELTHDGHGGGGRRSWVFEGEGVRVHPSVTVVGPVVVQDRTEVEEGATLIGPTVIGPGSRIGAKATVAQSVVGSDLTVPPGISIRHQVLVGDGCGVSAEASSAPEVPGPGWEPVPSASSFPRRPSVYLFVKRAVDMLVAALGLLLFAPLGVVIAALIKLESRGPIHFGHHREGRNGRPFRCWKFRTMVADADVQQRKLAQNNQVDGPQFKMEEDPRRTRVGRFLTLSNLDELPQLWNVLVGDMSLVGPRPSPFRENQICVPWREGRLSVRPGITGLWQVCRHDRDRGDFHQWVYYDLLYVQNASAWLDIKLVLATFASLARGGHVPLSWLLPPERYGERRASRRGDESVALPASQPERRGRARQRAGQAPRHEEARLVPGESDVVGG